jgi:hypothetical protein
VVVVVVWVVGRGLLVVVVGRVVVVVGRIVVEGRVVEVVVEVADRRLLPQSDRHAGSATAADRASPTPAGRATGVVSLNMARSPRST